MHSNTYSANTNTAGEKINQARAGSKNICHRKKWCAELKTRVMDTQWDRNKRPEQSVKVDEPCSLCCSLPHHTVLSESEQSCGSNTVIIWDVTVDWKKGVSAGIYRIRFKLCSRSAWKLSSS